MCVPISNQWCKKCWFDSRQYRRALHGSRRSLVADEVREVQSRHRRVLGELNLSVEAMLMPTIADQTNGDEDPLHETVGASSVANNNGATDELLLVGPHHEMMLSSPVACADLDSGFSGSSSASYRLVCIQFFTFNFSYTLYGYAV